MKKAEKRQRIIQDILILCVSIFVAVVFAKFGIFETLLHASGDIFLVDSFIAGLFFTSAFTTPLSIVAFGEIAQSTDSILLVSILGGLGAMCGDFLIYTFVKDRLSEDLLYVFGSLKKGSLKPLFKHRFFRWITFLVGGFIIASPFPDEIGIAMMGMSKAKMWAFLPVSFLFNAIGIFLVAIVARAL